MLTPADFMKVPGNAEWEPLWLCVVQVSETGCCYRFRDSCSPRLPFLSQVPHETFGRKGNVPFL